MAAISPPPPRFAVVDSGRDLQVHIPGKKNPWLRVTFVAIVVGLSVISIPALQQAALPWPFVIALILCGALNGGIIVYTLLRAFTFSETISVSANALRLRHGSWAFGRRREFALTQVRSLRYDPDQTISRESAFWFPERPSLAFDYGARTFRFGYDLDEPESELLIAMMAERLPAEARGGH